MTTELHPSTDPITEAVLEHMKGKPLDPSIRQHLRAEAAKVREEIRRKHGTLNMAVDLIREARNP